MTEPFAELTAPDSRRSSSAPNLTVQLTVLLDGVGRAGAVRSSSYGANSSHICFRTVAIVF
jgi:hypothetical protein